jgi:hypothetical protein
MPVREDFGEPRDLPARPQGQRRVRFPQNLPPWVRKALIAIAVVVLYFGARALNRFHVSFAARDAAIEALIPLMGVAQAREEVGRQHAACFEKAYTTKWGKWQDYSFDEKKHADCVLRSVMDDLSQRTMAAARAARAAEAARQPPSLPAATMPQPQAQPVAPPTMPAAPASLGDVAIGTVKVLGFSRTPQLKGRLSFVAIGTADVLNSLAMCSYALTCNDQAQGLPSGQRAIATCPLRVKGAKGEGEMAFNVGDPAPAEGDCSLELALTDGGRLRSNIVVVPLP